MPPIRTIFPYQQDRSTPAMAAADVARMAEATGLFDEFLAYDSCSTLPPVMGAPNGAPSGAKDSSSVSDPFVLATIAATATERIGIGATSDAVRRGPELVQTMLTLSGVTDAPVSFMLGAGELKNTAPLGYNRKKGLARFEELLQIWRLMLDTDGPIDFEGKHFNLRQAYFGSVKPQKPRIVGMGAGPRLTRALQQYGDGLAATAPGSWSTPESFGEFCTSLLEGVESHGRDPEQFERGFWALVVMHEDPDVIEMAMNDPFMRFLAAIFGRLHHGDWQAEGVDLVLPADWHYAMEYVPNWMTREECETLVSNVSDEMVRKAFIVGSAQEVGERLLSYAAAGANWMCVLNFLGQALPPEQHAGLMGASMELHAMLKAVEVPSMESVAALVNPM